MWLKQLLALILLLSSLSIVHVADSQDSEYPWTVAIYISGDNTLSDNVQQDLDEISAAALPDEVRVVALVDQDAVGDTRLLVLDGGAWTDAGLSAVNASWGSELDMGAPATLRDFVSWVFSEYPSTSMALDLWGHGAGWAGVCMDRGSWLTMPEIEEALEGREPDLISIDACQMGMVEVAYQLRDSADVFVASEKDVPAEGWHYGTWLERIGGAANAAEAGIALAKTYMSWALNNSGYSATVSVIDLGAMSPVALSINSFAGELRRSTDLLRNDITSSRATTERYDGDAEYDLAHFAQNIAMKRGSARLARLAAEVEDSVAAAIIYGDAWTRLGDESAEHANGMSIWMPLNGATSPYRMLDLAADTEWDEFLDSYGAYSPAPSYRAALSVEGVDGDCDGADEGVELSLDTDAAGSVMFEIVGPAANATAHAQVSDGHASGTISGLPAGTYMAAAYVYDASGMLAAITELPGAAAIESWLYVNGSVEGAGGRPVEEALVEVGWCGGSRANGTTDEKGIFSVKILYPTQFTNGTVTAKTEGASPVAQDADGPGELEFRLVVKDGCATWTMLGVASVLLYIALVAGLYSKSKPR